MDSICHQLTLVLPIDLCRIPVFYLGSSLGFICAVIGGAVEYKRMFDRQRRGMDEAQLPGCMIMMGGALGFTGAVVSLVAFFAGYFREAMLMGWGVGGGFLLGFFGLVGIWALFMQNAEPETTDEKGTVSHAEPEEEMQPQSEQPIPKEKR